VSATSLPPVWLLDVDGVVNVSHPEWPNVSNRHAYAAGHRYNMRWAPALIDRIDFLHTTGVVEIRWCTTWCAYADELERLFVLPPLGRAFTDEINGGVASIAKLAAARQVLAEGRSLIWTDDTEVPERGHLRDELIAAGALLIRPRASVGLTPQHLDLIETFARTVRST
jgi:hypothetical protein